MTATRCFWCNSDPVEAAARHEGPHATWCPHFREEQRGGSANGRTEFGAGPLGARYENYIVERQR